MVQSDAVPCEVVVGLDLVDGPVIVDDKLDAYVDGPCTFQFGAAPQRFRCERIKRSLQRRAGRVVDDNHLWIDLEPREFGRAVFPTIVFSVVSLGVLSE